MLNWETPGGHFTYGAQLGGDGVTCEWTHHGYITHGYCLSPSGPLMGGPQCRLSISRNGNVPCRYFRHFPVDF